MPVRRLDTLLALKVLTLVPDLNASDRRVAGALLEHYNRKTGRCDPGIQRIADLLGLCTRTVIRANDRLEAAKLFKKSGMADTHIEISTNQIGHVSKSLRRCGLRSSITSRVCQKSHLYAVNLVTLGVTSLATKPVVLTYQEKPARRDYRRRKIVTLLIRSAVPT
jgi:hypothetical protein